jgi:hypothetical protein
MLTVSEAASRIALSGSQMNTLSRSGPRPDGSRLALSAVVFCLVAAGQGEVTRAAAEPVAAARFAERRVALVVGNDAYATGALRNAVADAKAIATALTEVGFAVTQLSDVTLPRFERAVADFSSQLQPGDVALFYYSGHGVQVEGENYLIPVDYAGTDEVDVKHKAYSASRVHEKLAAARVRLLILDACRDNPYRSTRAIRRGLSEMSATGSVIAFATGPGTTASDNPREKNGLFTKHLLAALAEPGVPASELFRRVRARVNDASSGKQVPWLWDGLIGEFVFRPGTPASTAGSPSGSGDLALRAELALWDSIKDSPAPATFEQYLKDYPSGTFRAAAQAKLDAFRTSGASSNANSSGTPLRRLWIVTDRSIAGYVEEQPLQSEFLRHVSPLAAGGVETHVVTGRLTNPFRPGDFIANVGLATQRPSPTNVEGVSMLSCRVHFRVQLMGNPLFADRSFEDTAVGANEAIACQQALAKAVRSAVSAIVQTIRKG